jgi:1-acyl-sn-glycerol-3-phosphate acyltransferase
VHHIGPARGGLGYLIDVSGVPVVPIAISGFLDISYADFFLGKRKLVITIGTPMHITVPEPHTKEAYVEAGNQVMKKIESMLCA